MRGLLVVSASIIGLYAIMTRIVIRGYQYKLQGDPVIDVNCHATIDEGTSLPWRDGITDATNKDMVRSARACSA